MMKDGKGGFEDAANKAKGRNWKVVTFECGHYAMRDQPAELVKKLEALLD